MAQWPSPPLQSSPAPFRAHYPTFRSAVVSRLGALIAHRSQHGGDKGFGRIDWDLPVTLRSFSDEGRSLENSIFDWSDSSADAVAGKHLQQKLTQISREICREPVMSDRTPSLLQFKLRQPNSPAPCVLGSTAIRPRC